MFESIAQFRISNYEDGPLYLILKVLPFRRNNNLFIFRVPSHSLKLSISPLLFFLLAWATVACGLHSLLLVLHWMSCVTLYQLLPTPQCLLLSDGNNVGYSGNKEIIKTQKHNFWILVGAHGSVTCPSFLDSIQWLKTIAYLCSFDFHHLCKLVNVSYLYITKITIWGIVITIGVWNWNWKTPELKMKLRGPILWPSHFTTSGTETKFEAPCSR